MIDSEKQLAWLEAQAEQAYGLMYDVVSPTAAAGHYSDAKEALADAIGMARRLGRPEAAERLEARLAHIKAVFRSQFG
jgi:hypothetical protein